MMIQFFKKHIFLTSIIAGLAIFAIFGTASVFSSRFFHYHIPHNASEAITDIYVSFSDDSLLTIEDIHKRNSVSIIHLKSLNPGQGTLLISYTLQSSDRPVTHHNYTNFIVNKAGMIFLGDKLLDYTGFVIMHYSFMIYFGLMAFYFFWLFKEQKKESYYSFRTMNFCSSAIFFFIIFVVYFSAITVALIKDYMLDTRLLMLITRNLLMAFSAMTIPFMTIFYMFLAISNISLMRHEGKRLTNMLGLGIAVVFAVGTGINTYLFIQHINTGAANLPIAVAYTVYSSCFCIFQLMLIGSVVCCLMAAYRNVEYDKDFIIILGCAIRKDGTLYPQIRGRVDRAISFWKEQYKTTGIMARFIPSGGQGSDEIISEAEAMTNYLLECGINPELIIPETESTSTLENMKFSNNIIKENNPNASVAFATTNYHVFRSGILAGQANLKADGIGSKTKWYFWPNAMLREVVGMLAAQSRLQWIMTFILITVAVAFEYIFAVIS